MNEKPIYCEQTQLDVLFKFDRKPISSGMDPGAYEKFIHRDCSGLGKEGCPVRVKNQADDYSGCNVSKMLRGAA